MVGNTDPRAVRTREKLVAAFHDAVRTQDPATMTVAALTRAAGVNRTSFYTHFESPEDLAVHALGELFDVVANADIVLRSEHAVTPADASRRALVDIVRFVDERRTSYANLLGPGAAPAVKQAITAAYVERAVEALSRHPNRPPHADPLLTAHFLAGGVLGVLGTWLATPDPQHSLDDLVDALVQCLPAWINR
ncbi:TetR/AcrR family transcriptional regulator [Cryptosporangium phraense]|uniref:TetR/AcrR family transcriptional regulator n=2 Tax=Cryptosporangium phraense TaxID=2593070 RepID=A0A545AEA9_9ACTN|nr:TetR/AcrR family transcriptional regulator [Cryptosporangium phraense]